MRVEDFSAVILPPLPKFPGMISAAEERYLYWAAREWVQGKGAVVELGSWLGRSSSRLAAGLRDNPNQPSLPLHCFDTWLWRGREMDSVAGFSLPAGADYFGRFQNNTQDIFPIVAHQGDFTETVWNHGPIELLLMDGPKLAKDVLAVFEKFGPDLLAPGCLLISQDYLRSANFELTFTLECLRPALRLEHVVSSSMATSAGFVVAAPVDLPSLRDHVADLEIWDSSEILRAWEEIAEPLHVHDIHTLDFAPVFFLYERGFVSEAVDLTRKTRIDADLAESLKSFSRGHIYFRYPEVFDALGLSTSLKNKLAYRKHKRYEELIRERSPIVSFVGPIYDLLAGNSWRKPAK